MAMGCTEAGYQWVHITEECYSILYAAQSRITSNPGMSLLLAFIHEGMSDMARCILTTQACARDWRTTQKRKEPFHLGCVDLAGASLYAALQK